MSLFKTNTENPTTQTTPAAPPKSTPKPEPKKESDRPDVCLPLEKDAADSPPQRGSISSARANVIKLQLWLADNLRKSIAPDVPLDVPLERTQERLQMVQQRLPQVIARANVKLPPDVPQQDFINGVLNEIFGFGPIESLIQTDDISEIMVNGPYIIFVESSGRLVESGYKFLDDDHVERIVKRIVKPLGRVADQDNPLIDARLPDGSRVERGYSPLRH